MAITDRLSALTPEQRALFEKLREQQKKQKAPVVRAPQPPPIPRRGEGDVWPLSFDQERLWFLYMLNPEDTSYNIDTASRIRGPLDQAALEQAFQAIPKRHEIWRTAFPAVDGRPVQAVLPEMRLPSAIVDLRALPRELREPTAWRWMAETTRVPFPMETGPLAKATLLRLDDEDCVVQLVVHHIVTDWVTFQLFWREIGLLYEAFAAGQVVSEQSPLPEPVVQYADYTAWQREWMSGEVEQYFLRYWVEHLKDAPLALEVPTDRPRPPVMTSNGDRVPVRVERAADLKALARREGLTPFMAVLAAYQLVLSRWSGAGQVIVGSPNANRNRLEIQEIFGFFLTQLPFCTDFSGDPSLREALRRTRDVALAAYAHQDLPFGKLVEALQPERDLSRAPIIQVVLLLLDGSVLSPRLADLELAPVDVHDGNARYDVMFAMWDHPELIHGWYEYNSDLWDKTTAARLVEAFNLVLDAMLADPERPLSDVAWVSPAAAHQVLAEWNDTEVRSPMGSLHGLIAAQAARTPGAIAAVFDGETLTYRELHGRARRLARHLISLGVTPDARVGVRMERSLDLIVALLGILEAGAAYVPLDPTWPEERLKLVLESAGLAAVLDRTDPTDPADRTDPSALFFAPELTAYVIFTSGSTGTPKGVAVPHRGIVNRLLWMQETYGLTPEDRVLQKTPFGFDVSVWEFFWPLLAGARLVFARPEGHKDPRYLAELIAREGITTLHFVPSMLQVFLEALEASGAPALPKLRRVMASGEALPPEMVRRFQALLPGVELHNLYGPTEASVDVSFWPSEPAPARVPIGRPIANLRLHVVDRHLRPQPIGVAGELLIGGIGLARGYLGRPELTAAAFIPDSFGGRLYRTGDLVRTLADGNIEFLGRIDHQVKIRGVRIELGEVETVLGRHPAVGECVAVARDGELIAYVTGQSPEPDELRRWLLERLPEAMVPSTFVVLDAFPLSASGKVDRRALPAPERSRETAGAAYVAPRNPEEELLAGLWEKVLGIERPGIHDHFFSLGGHSLLATRLTLYIRDAFAVDLPVRAIFQAPTIAAQAELVASLLESGATVESGRIQPLPREAWPLSAPLSFPQERLWFLDRLMPGSPAYNLAVALRLDGPLDIEALADAFGRLVERHEALRTALPEREGRPVQEVAAAGSAGLQEIDLSGSANPEADARRLAEADALRPFDLSAGPLLRATLLSLDPEGEEERRHVLLLAMHHIVSDAWSMGVLVDDLTALYAGRPLPELPVQYADYAVWQRERLTAEEVARQLAFWRDQLAGAPPFLDLPTDRPRPAVQSLRGGMVPFDLDAATSAALGNLARQRGATLYMVLLAGWGALLGRLADQRDLVLGTAVANRDRPEVEGLIGFFVNTLAMRVDLTGSPSFDDLLGRLRHRVLEAFSHRDLPFEKLVEELHPARDRSRQPIFQAMLTFQNVPMGRADLAGLTLTPLEVEGQTTKFDLTLTLFEEGGRIVGRLEYASDLFDRATAERWADGFGRLLAGAAAAPGTRVAELPLVSPEELRQVLVEPNQTAAAYPRDASLGDLFVEEAARHPATAAVSGEEEISWQELERRSARIARHLLRRGAGLEARVGLVAGRTSGLIAGLVGIVRAGGVYVPLDPMLPPERLAWMLADSGARLLLAERQFLAGLPPAALPQGVRIVPLEEAEADEASETPLPTVPAEALAYVMYTSGSTGTPKGVAVTHRNVIRLVRGTEYADLGPDQIWLQAAPVSFDASTLEIWAPLLNGGRLALMPPGRAALDDVSAAIARFGVTSLWLTAGLFHQMAEYQLDGLRPLRQLLAGGDAVAPEAARRVLESLPDLALIDGYGPTEGTTFTCCHRVTGKETGAAVPIGRPIANARVYVLSSEEGVLEPVQEGTAGELYAGGDGLARGYLDRPDLTAERFVPDPFSGRPGERLYRTGDRVRWTQGNLEFLGRLDDQVKIRGFRVEPGEVEAALAEYPAVRQAAVLPREAQSGKILAAYVALAGPGAASAADLQRFLRERLPEPMVPTAWVFLEDLPLTANGKVDRRALAALEVESVRTAVEHVPPRTPLEEKLVEAVAGVLGLEPERIGVQDNFFDLGGHSLLATQLVAQLRQQHGIEVSLPLLFDSAHLADLADQITAREIKGADEALLEELLAELEGSEP